MQCCSWVCFKKCLSVDLVPILLHVCRIYVSMRDPPQFDGTMSSASLLKSEFACKLPLLYLDQDFTKETFGVLRVLRL